MQNAANVCRGCIKFSSKGKKRVIIKQRGTRIICDKALQNNKLNTVDATGNVMIYRSDSEYPLRGDKLFFDGNTSVARLRDNVYYKDDKISFTTEKFDYNTKTEEGFYFDGGVMEDSLNTLVSQRGYVFKNNDVIVKDDVVITTPDYLVYADSLKYNSDTETVFMIAPTTLHSDSSILYTEGGSYNTRTSYAHLTKNSKLYKGSQTIFADTIIYDEEKQIGEAFSNIVMNDSAQMLMLKSNYLYHDGNSDYALVTDSARMLLYSGFDTLFAHADTLTNYKDTAEIQYVSGFPNVRFFRLDVQGKCDSLVYSMADSVTTMYYDPMLWAIYNQLSGDVIKIYNRNNTISHLEMLGDAFLVSREDSIRFNQVSGKKITGYVKRNDIERIQVDGAAESLYYSREGNDLMGYNQTESSYLTISMKNGLVTRLSLKPASTGEFHSIDAIPYEDQFLRGFQWRSDLRPIAPWDIYRKIPLELETKKKRRSGGRR